MRVLRLRQSKKDAAATQRFHTRLGVGMTAFSLLLFGVLALFTSNSPHYENRSRLLLQEGESTDYSSSSCHDIFESTGVSSSEEQCKFARSCNQGQGIWASWVFCTSSHFSVWVGVLSPFIIVWLILLFRMLGSTAEDFFSPALEMFSTKLGLPPRFAGVSLLALGNGAADVSATISAISADPVNGYKLSLGALTGAAMVIGSVVSALVVITAGGVPCRGALVRDVTALGVAVLIVWNQFASDGKIGPDTISLFLSLYCVFVVVVLLADIYHRAVVLPRLRAIQGQQELQRQLQHGESARQALGSTVGDDANRDPLPPNTGGLDRFVTALSNYDNANMATGEQPQQWEGIESDDLMNDRPVMLPLHGNGGILSHKHQGGERNEDDGPANHYTMLQEESPTAEAGNAALAENAVNAACVEPGSFGMPAADWKEAILGGKQELFQHFADEWEDIWHNGDLDILTKIFLMLEFPFLVLRKMTVAIPCEGYYVRSLVALAMLLSPLWLTFYMWSNNDTNILGLVLLIIWLGLAAIALSILRLAPAGPDGQMIMYAAAPIALYGFVIGATWIDAIANILVSVLDFVGICLRIPGPVVGLTILAWGNSMSDLSANITMARKGLANMAVRLPVALLRGTRDI